MLEVSAAGEEAEGIMGETSVASQRRLSQAADDRRLLDDLGEWLTVDVAADE